MKYCPKCCKNKDESEFFKCRSYKDGLYYICKECSMIAKFRYKYSEKGKLADKNIDNQKKEEFLKRKFDKNDRKLVQNLEEVKRDF